MIRKQISRVWALTILVLVPVVQGCMAPYRVSGDPINGIVLENRSNLPVAETHVLAVWEGDWGFGATVCFHVASAVTNTDGRYHIPAWKKKHRFGIASKQRVSVTPYKTGYRWTGIKSNNEIKILAPDFSPPEQRLQYLLRVSPGCDPEDGSEKSRIPLMRAVYEEAQSIATTKEDEKVLNFILYDLEKVELEFEEAEKRFLKRARALR